MKTKEMRPLHSQRTMSDISVMSDIDFELECTKLAEKNTSLLSELSRRKNKYHALEMKMRVFKKEKREMGKEIKRLERQNLELSTFNDNIETDYRSLLQRKYSQDIRYVSVKKKENVLSEVSEKTHQKNVELKAVVEKLKKSASEMQIEVREKETEIRKLKETDYSKSKLVSKMQIRVDNLYVQKAELETQLTETQGRLNETLNENKIEISKLLESIQHLKRKLKAERSGLGNMEGVGGDGDGAGGRRKRVDLKEVRGGVVRVGEEVEHLQAVKYVVEQNVHDLGEFLEDMKKTSRDIVHHVRIFEARVREKVNNEHENKIDGRRVAEEAVEEELRAEKKLMRREMKKSELKMRKLKREKMEMEWKVGRFEKAVERQNMNIFTLEMQRQEYKERYLQKCKDLVLLMNVISGRKKEKEKKKGKWSKFTFLCTN